MKSKPLFTVITPTYNRVKYLKECLDSIKNQTFTNFEHLIVDGFSTDGTFEFVENYKRVNTNMDIKLIQRPAKGISNAFNEGVQNASGKYLIFINSDDFFYSNNDLKHVSAVLKKNPEIEWLQTRSSYLVGNQIVWLPNALLKNIFYLLGSFHCPLSHQAMFLKKDVYRRFGLYDENLAGDMDTEFMYRISDKIEIHFMNTFTGVFRLYSGQFSQSRPFISSRYLILKSLYEKYENLPIYTGILRQFKYKKLLKSV